MTIAYHQARLPSLTATPADMQQVGAQLTTASLSNTKWSTMYYTNTHKKHMHVGTHSVL